MCFTKEITLGLTCCHLLTGMFLQYRGWNFSKYQLFYTFFIMELIQYFQYMTLDDCDHWLNQWATRLAYIHLCFQMVSTNYYAFGQEPNSDMVKAIMRLCMANGVFMLLRLPMGPITSFLHHHLSFLGLEFPDTVLAGMLL